MNIYMFYKYNRIECNVREHNLFLTRVEFEHLGGKDIII